MSMTNGGLPGVTSGGTLNVYSAARDVIAFPCEAPHWVDLSLGFAYTIVIANQTGADITSGEINLQGADADPDNSCIPGTFRDLDPVNDCGQLVTGIPWDPPVRIPITPERPIRAFGVCMYAVPCPLQFMQVTPPAGTMAIAIVTRLRRTNFDHYGPYGGIIPPMQLATPFSAQLPGGQQAPAQVAAQAPAQVQAQRQPQRQPQPPQQPMPPPQPQPPPQPRRR